MGQQPVRERTRPEPDYGMIGDIGGRAALGEPEKKICRQVRCVAGSTEHRVETTVPAVDQGSTKSAKRAKARGRAILEPENLRVGAPADHKPVAIAAQRIRNVIDQLPSVQYRVGLGAAEAARFTAGEDGAEQLHETGRSKESGRARTRSSSPAARARSSASAVGAEIVASIGQSESTAFSTSS